MPNNHFYILVIEVLAPERVITILEISYWKGGTIKRETLYILLNEVG